MWCVCEFTQGETPGAMKYRAAGAFYWCLLHTEFYYSKLMKKVITTLLMKSVNMVPTIGTRMKAFTEWR